MVRRALRVGAALAIAAVASCGAEPAPEITAAEYRAALGLVCADTAARLEGLSQPSDSVDVGTFAAAVAETLRGEAEAARALAVPDELDDDHRAFIRNTDEQAARWEELRATPSTDAAFADLTRQIGELTLGRDDLTAEMGVAGCARSAT